MTAAAAGAAVPSTTTDKRRGRFFAQAQRLGRSLMLPIAVLPAAGLLLRLGQADMLGAEGVASWSGMGWVQPVADVLAAAGGALFDNLPILFAVGVAVGFARKSDGSTGLAGLVGYLVFSQVLAALAAMSAPWGGTFGTESPGACVDAVTEAGLDPADFACAAPTYAINYGVLGGITMGIVAALFYQRYYRIKLPPYLAFFGGRRFVPIVTAATAVFIAVLFACLYPAFDYVISGFGDWVTNPGNSVLGGFVFGTVNRLLIPFGLHHLLNNLPWFQFGEYVNPETDAVAHGDIFRFLAGDPSAGTFMTGFFPIMMFALPAAALAIWRTARPDRRKVTGGIMVSVALTAFLTGITEPLEFAFAYVAFPLYVVHAVLTGTSLALVNALDIHHGFTFSAGAFDYVINFGIAQKPLLLIPIGLAYAVVYYFLFVWVIKRFNLGTPGREAEGVEGSAPSVFDEAQEAAAVSTGKRDVDRMLAEDTPARDAGRDRPDNGR